MSENYCGTDGYKPLVLPEKGEELLEGRQYVLTPLARMILVKEFGLSDIPTIVECLHRRIAASVTLTLTINLETGKRVKSRREVPAQDAVFRGYSNKGKWIKFVLDIKKLDELAPMYDPSHAIPGGNPRKYSDKEMERLEADWFAQRSLPSVHRKFRGCSLRWWSKGAVEHEGNFIPRKRSGEPARTSKEAAAVSALIADL